MTVGKYITKTVKELQRDPSTALFIAQEILRQLCELSGKEDCAIVKIDNMHPSETPGGLKLEAQGDAISKIRGYK